MWQRQPDAVIAQANPVSGTLYPVLAATEDVSIISISIKVTWTVQPDPLQVHTIIDGNIITYNQANPVSTTNYYPVTIPYANEVNQAMDSGSDLALRTSYPMDGQDVAVSAETTGGTVSNLTCRVKWARLLPT